MALKRVLFILLASALAVAGCRKKAEEKAQREAAERIIEKAIEKQGGKAKVDIAKQKVEFKTEKGEMTIAAAGGATVPEDFPKDVYIYKGTSILMSGKQQDTFMLMLESKDDPKKVVETYKQQMAAQGWKEETALTMPGQTVLAFKKGDRTATAMIAEGEGKTQINLTVAEK